MAESMGRFVWYELLTTDVDGAKAFYSEVVRWKTKAWTGPTEYTMCYVGEEPVAGLMVLPEEAKEMGAPPNWLGYIGTPDVDAAARQVGELGGRVMVPPQDIPEIGRFAVAADPQGAVFALFTPKPGQAPAPGEGEPRAGDLVWNELYTTDYESAWTFYEKLAGWRHTDSFDMGPGMGTYFMFESAGPRPSRGGMSNVAKAHGFPPHWLYYISVEDIAAAAERVTGKGGTILSGPMEVPGGDMILQARDPQGAMFALHSAKK